MAHDPDRLSKSDYQAALRPLQERLAAQAQALARRGARLLVLLEGRDTAGKGGVASAIAECLSPRQCRVVALDKPGERERGQWYFQRYVPHLPGAGEIVVFDRSWYNRAGVERVMGFASEAQVQAFLHQVPAFERLLVDDGLLLFKYWLTVDQAEQEQRFAERREDPLKRWKLSPIDVQARRRYAAYGEARNQMLAATHRPEAPWTLVNFNDQRRGRLTLLADLLARLPEAPPPAEPPEFEALAQAPQHEKLPAGLQTLPPYRPAARNGGRGPA